MPIITISRGSFCQGKEIAEKLGKKLGYECVSQEILFETAEYFKIPAIKLSSALNDSPPLWNRFTGKREKYLSFIKYSILHRLQKDNIVYHGLAGPLFLKGIPHALKVRIVCDMENRITEMQKNKDISEQRARQLLGKNDEKERKWSQRQFETDISGNSHYDLVLHLDKISTDDAVNIISETTKRDCFQRTSGSQKIFDNLLCAAKIQSILIEKFPKVGVKSKNGKFYIENKGVFGQEEYMKKQIEDFMHELPEFKTTKFSVSSVLRL